MKTERGKTEVRSRKSILPILFGIKILKRVRQPVKFHLAFVRSGRAAEDGAVRDRPAIFAVRPFRTVKCNAAFF